MSSDWASSTEIERAQCPVCTRRIRVLKNGTLGPHSTGIRSTNWPYTAPRCPGWGKKPKGEA